MVCKYLMALIYILMPLKNKLMASIIKLMALILFLVPSIILLPPSIIFFMALLYHIPCPLARWGRGKRLLAAAVEKAEIGT